MLAQSFLAPADLGLSDAQFDALRKTLVLLETDRLQHVSLDALNSKDIEGPFTGHFNMGVWNDVTECGTVCCIRGTAELVGDVSFRGMHMRGRLADLFFAAGRGSTCWNDITPAQAARALRSYLTTGEPNWQEALSHV